MFLYRVKFLESRASRRQNAQAGQGAKNGGNPGRYMESAPSPLIDPALYHDPMLPVSRTLSFRQALLFSLVWVAMLSSVDPYPPVPPDRFSPALSLES
jgi:hypothetical protein